MSEAPASPVHLADPQSVEEKGLQKGSIGLLGSVVIGLASTAPAYSLAATIGYVVMDVGVQAPAYMLLAFVPMLFVAYSYREFNRVIPDCGTSFTWVTKSFGPYLGWMGGWAVAVSGSIFIGSAAQVVGSYLLTMTGPKNLGWTNPTQCLPFKAPVTGWSVCMSPHNGPMVALVGCLFILLMAWIAYRGLQLAAEVQMGLVALQYAALVLLMVAGFRAVFSGESALTPEMSWLNPMAVEGGVDAGVKGFLLCVFLYWGWDAVLAVNEETKDPEKTPGRAALIATVILLAGYVLVTMAILAFAGTKELTRGKSVDNVFAAVAPDLIGGWGTTFVLIVIIISTAASAQTTILPTARGTLSMAVYKALPKRFASVHPKYHTPGFSTFMTAAVGLTFFIVVNAISEDILADTIYSIGLAIAFYYSLTAIACVWYFRRQAFAGVREFGTMFLMPLIGGISLAVSFILFARLLWVDPEQSYTIIFGVGGVFVLGIGSLLLGVVLMIIWNVLAPAFFKGETLRADTPVLVPDV
jgi:amino acid transporter